MCEQNIQERRLTPAEQYQSELNNRRAALIGRNVEHYLPIFDRLDKGGSSWNWCGFFFGPMWFGYRRLYGWAAIAFVIPLIVGFVLGAILYSVQADELTMNAFSVLAALPFRIFFAIVANKAYKKRIDNLAVRMPVNEEERARYIQSNGDISEGALVLLILINIVMNVGVQFL